MAPASSVVSRILLALSLFSGSGWGQDHDLDNLFNPILPGAHPDPSCIHVPKEKTYFCASSSFNIFPGIPIHASKDLKSWKLVGHVLNRPSQLPELAESVGSTSGIWAPTLRYHGGTYYLVTTMVHDKRPELDPSRWDNIIFETDNIWDESTWSDPVHFPFQGYDPSPWWDDNEESHIVAAHAWRVDPGIHMAKVDLKTGKVKSDWKKIWNGTGGLAPEGPRIYKKDGYYYLMIAEGKCGTGKEHKETMARSRNLYGPYDPNPANPVLTNANTGLYLQAVGHADLFQDVDGYWWAAALAVRSGPEYINWPMGRETVLTNVTWDRGAWPVFNSPIHGEIPGLELPEVEGTIPGDGQAAGGEDVLLDFPPGSKLPPHFVYWRPPVKSNYVISPKGHENWLQLKPSKLNLTGIDGNSNGPGGITFVGRRQAHSWAHFQFDLDFRPKNEGEEAGIALFLSQNHHARLGVTLLPQANSTTLVPHFTFRAESHVPVPPPFTQPIPTDWLNDTITLELRAVDQTVYRFSAGPSGRRPWVIPLVDVPAETISWGFTGALMGAYATTNGGNGSTPAYLKRWDYMAVTQLRDCWNETLYNCRNGGCSCFPLPGEGEPAQPVRLV
ncbi:xylosidase : arab-like proteininofuranosidase [Westerdykella ornata]|uniref:Xylosidase: arab-like proteininofuranosidase n=1 Tax=Westerdykella ornata TaxID=318751 RepID=A0A6A6J6J3_WESOR|nr:xylosidase : arab-like proteininofuranosidase [Westerdykella ornata]KAF2271588.1 xylosidase : arab-like proteininofuranosidase [Westerdykella ornata]